MTQWSLVARASAIMALGLFSLRAQEPASGAGPVTFKSRVDLVLVPVVVRDSQARPVPGLEREDFELLDNGKPQVISRFTVESYAAQPSAQTKGFAQRTDAEAPASTPQSFIALLFDDVHLGFSDLVYARDAANRHLTANLKPGDRAAIYTTSGRTALDFTADRALLQKTLLAIRSQSPSALPSMECPPLTYYMADLIENKNDERALGVAAADAMICANLQRRQDAISLTRATARRVLTAGDLEARVTMLSIRDVIRKMSTMPGRRNIVLVSPGFLTFQEAMAEMAEDIERALRANVLVSALDARGLYTSAPDITMRTYSAEAIMARLGYDRAGAFEQASVMADLAAGTGGTFYQNSNDLDEGFRRTSATPELIYILGFSPTDLKADGSYHKLRVSVKRKDRLSLQVRRGYYAPRTGTDPAGVVKREIEETFFSREERSDFPIELNTRFFKTGEEDATLAVLARVDLSQLPFRKAEERNLDNLTFVSGLFDENGNYIRGIEKILQMRLLDRTLEELATSGITVRTDFSVKPGRYMIRLVVRDSEGKMFSTRNGAIEIP
jgi:VWFA-related protein